MLNLHRHPRVLILLFATLSGGSCAPASVRANSPSSSAAPAIATSIADRLYFGRSIAGGGQVSEAQWAEFLRDVVTPRFPAGLTVWRAEGQWRDGEGVIVREQSFVLELIHAAEPRAEVAITEIVVEYRRRFRQESVLRVRDRVEVMD